MSEASENYYISQFYFDFPHDVCKTVRNVITFANSFIHFCQAFGHFNELTAQVKLFS